MSDASSWSDRLAAQWPVTARQRALAAGLAFSGPGALVALVIVGGYVGLSSPGDIAAFDPEALGVAFGLPLAAGLAAAVAGAPLWWLIVERPDEPTALRGGFVGAVVGVAAHPLMWLLFGVGAGVVALFAGGSGTPADVVIGGGVNLLGAFVLFSVVGLLLTGIVTVPVAAGTGVALAHLRRMAPGVDGGAVDRVGGDRAGADRDGTDRESARRRPDDL